jgi:hypothetical protein
MAFMARLDSTLGRKDSPVIANRAGLRPGTSWSSKPLCLLEITPKRSHLRKVDRGFLGMYHAQIARVIFREHTI